MQVGFIPAVKTFFCASGMKLSALVLTLQTNMSEDTFYLLTSFKGEENGISVKSRPLKHIINWDGAKG